MAHQTTRPYFLGIQAVSPHSTKRSSTLPNALAHNRRSLQAQHGARSTIDPALSHLNYTLAGMGAVSAIIEHWKGEQGRLKARKNAPHAVEVLFTLPAHWAGDARAYFTDCLNWACEEFGTANLLTADVHNDESQPHCHALFLPIVETPHRATPQAWLNPVGGRGELNQRCERFFSTVSAAHGLTQPPTVTLRHGDKQHLSNAVIEALHQQQALELKSPRWQVIRAAIECDPAPWCDSLGIDINAVLAAVKKPVKAPSFVAIMTRPQRLGKRAKTVKPLARDFDEKVKPLSCVRGFKNSEVIHRQNLTEKERAGGVISGFNWGHIFPKAHPPTATKKMYEHHQRTRPKKWDSFFLDFALFDTLQTAAPFNSKNPPPSILLNHEPPTGETDNDTFTESTTRERESSILATHWDGENGIFNPPPAKQSVKAHYAREVRQGLDQLHQSH